ACAEIRFQPRDFRLRISLFPKFQIPKPDWLVKAGKHCRRPTRQFRRPVFTAIEAIKVRPPDILGFRRGLAQIGKWNHYFHLPEFIFVAGVGDGAFDFDGAFHAFGCETPIAGEILRYATLIQFVVDDRVEHAAERVPLKLEVPLQLSWCDKEFDDLFFPEFAVARSEGGLDI